MPIMLYALGLSYKSVRTSRIHFESHKLKNAKHDSKQLFITIYAELNYEAINNSINKISKAIKKQTQIFW
jgi:hypothetical protein